MRRREPWRCATEGCNAVLGVCERGLIFVTPPHIARIWRDGTRLIRCAQCRTVQVWRPATRAGNGEREA
jgi:hypothetical protein